MKFFIYPKLEGRNWEITVEYFAPKPLSDKENFKVYGRKIVWIESNRPLFRKKSINKRRPEYKLMTKQNYQAQIYFSEIVRCIDEWVRKNLD